VGLISNAVGLKELVEIYEDSSRQTLDTKAPRNLPKFMQIAAAECSRLKTFQTSSSALLWDTAVSKINAVSRRWPKLQ
jgi:hypothetical protein